MTTRLDTRFRAIAVRLLNSFGGTATWIVPGIKGPTEHVIKILPPYDYSESLGMEFPDSKLQTMFAAKDLPFVPTNTHVLRFDGSELMVEKLTSIYSGDEVAVWVAELAAS